MLIMFQMLFFPHCRKETIATGLAAGEIQVTGNSDQIQLDGVQLVAGSKSPLLLNREGKKYLIDVEKKTIQEISDQNLASSQPGTSPQPAPEATPPKPAANKPSAPERNVYIRGGHQFMEVAGYTSVG